MSETPVPWRWRFKGALPHQQALLECRKRIVVVTAGVKSGKSVGAALFAIEELMRRPGARGIWVDPTYQQALDPGMRTVYGLLQGELVSARRESFPPSLTLRNGSSLDFRSAETPDNLYGTVYDFGVVDEAGRVSEAANDAVQSTIAPTAGPIRYVSNPCPRRSWFYRLYLRGLDPEDPDVQSFRWRTLDNAAVPALRIYVEDVRRNEPEWKYLAMCEGMFFDVGTSALRGVRECAVGALCPPERGRRYVGGLDLARLVDFVVLIVVDELAGEVVSFERWHRVAWEETVRRVFETAKRYGDALIRVDSTGVGDVPLEMLDRAGVRVQGVKFSSTSKAQMIERLGALIEKRRITYPPIDVLLGELESLEGESTPSGVTRYAAPPGAHDDCVMSLALACMELPLEDPSALALPIVVRVPSRWATRVTDPFGRRPDDSAYGRALRSLAP